MDFDFEPCSVCSIGDGLYCCKICNLKYCSEHLCLHLNVAWETNTWTSRNSNLTESGNELSESNEQDQDVQISEEESYNPHRTSPILGNAKTLLAYTETQLEAQLEFYNAQARRIRRELERRSIPLSSIQTKPKFKPVYNRKYNEKRTITNVAKFTSRATTASELLSNYLREGRITLDYIKQQLNIKSK